MIEDIFTFIPWIVVVFLVLIVLLQKNKRRPQKEGRIPVTYQSDKNTPPLRFDMNPNVLRSVAEEEKFKQGIKNDVSDIRSDMEYIKSIVLEGFASRKSEKALRKVEEEQAEKIRLKNLEEENARIKQDEELRKLQLEEAKTVIELDEKLKAEIKEEKKKEELMKEGYEKSDKENLEVAEKMEPPLSEITEEPKKRGPGRPKAHPSDFKKRG